MCLPPTKSSKNQESSKNRQTVKATDGFWSGNNENKENSCCSRSAEDAPRSSSPIKRNKPSDMIVVLDMDETLIHCTKHHESNVPEIKHFDSFQLAFEGEESVVYCIRERPKLRSFLEVLSDHFEVHVFTKGSQSYAESVLDILEDFQRGKYFAKRWYRHHCTRTGSATVFKDLSIISSDLSRIVLVDDRMQNFRANPENGIPISEFCGQDRHDNELMALWRFLRIVNFAPDVRPVINSLYGDHTRKYLEEEDFQAYAKYLDTERGEQVSTSIVPTDDDNWLVLDQTDKDATQEPPRGAQKLRSLFRRIGTSTKKPKLGPMDEAPMSRVRAHTSLHDH